uniref:Uncharacterized protein n=1 Tax=Quercus lobata TaxID=97700 RepID=A0A7N2L0W2_QUELO
MRRNNEKQTRYVPHHSGTSWRPVKKKVSTASVVFIFFLLVSALIHDSLSLSLSGDTCSERGCDDGFVDVKSVEDSTKRERERERAHPSGQPSFGQRDHIQREIAPRERSNPEPRALRLRTLRLRRSTSTSTSNHTQIAPFDFAGEPRAQITHSTLSRSHRDGIDHTDRMEIAIGKWLGFDKFDRI